MPLLAFPGGYGGMVQSDGGRMSLSCCIRRDVLARAAPAMAARRREAVLAHIMATTRGAREALARRRAGRRASCPPARSVPASAPRYADGIFFTGNIAGEAHPVIAEGISMAIQSSGLLARLLIAGRGAGLCASLEAPLRPPHPCRVALRASGDGRHRPRRRAWR